MTKAGFLRQELIDWDGNLRDNVPRQKLIDSVRKFLEKKGISGGYDPDGQALREFVQNNIRPAYAYKVGRSRGYRGSRLNLFIQLRLAHCWDYCNNWSQFEELYDLLWDRLKLVNSITGQILSDDGKGFCWLSQYGEYQISACHIPRFLAKGGNLRQLDQILSLTLSVDRLYGTTGFCMSTKWHTYRNGLQIGAFFREVIAGISGKHLNDWPRFMRAFRYSIFISPKLNHRYLRKLDRLNNRQLKLTMTDRRNWTLNGNDQRGFRLRSIVKLPSKWQPLRKCHFKDKIWLTRFNRVPKNQSVRTLPDEVVSSFTKSSFRTFIKGIQCLSEPDGHTVLALARLINLLGKDFKKFLPEDMTIHDAGIELPNVPNSDHKTFLLRYRHKWNDAVRVVKSWDALIKEGIKPLSKDGLAKSIEFLSKISYSSFISRDFAEESALHHVPEERFHEYEKIFLDSQDVHYESIPKIIISQGDFKFYRLNRSDPRGVYLGHYTNCCQHPDGAGASCALHGLNSPDGAFVVLEYQGKIRFQSWVWRRENILVFDNIEGRIKADLIEEAKKIYLLGMKAFVGKFNINQILVGTGNADITYNEFPKIGWPHSPDGYFGYRDSSQAWRIK